MAQLDLSQGVAIATLIAATIPLVASVFAAFHPSTRIGSPEDYFLSSGRVDVDSFLKASIGYSLQVASIYLFFSWAISYGIWAMFVAFAWGLGFVLVSLALRWGYLDGFINESKGKSITIHGFIAEHLSTDARLLRRICILVVSLATVIGLGGTMITEIDYTTRILLRATGLLDTTNPTSLSDSANLVSDVFDPQSAIVHVTILMFVLLYVLWGGYKAVIVTERIQVPAAYVAFLMFAMGLIFSSVSPTGSNSGKILLGATSLILLAILVARWRLLHLLNEKAPAPPGEVSVSAAKASAWLTFLPLIVLSFIVFVFSLSQDAGPFSTDVFFPKIAAPAGFGIVGMLSLFIANVIWQFVDISSLQRLQSVAHKTDTPEGRHLVARALSTTGIEAGLGWLLIITAGLSLRLIGLTEPEQVADVATYVMKASNVGFVLVPLLGFAVSVFMLSTISGFVSALAYVSFYDVVPSENLESAGGLVREQLARARLVTLLSVLFLYLGYVVLKQLLASQDRISAALYAIYAFQIAIAPSVIGAAVVARGIHVPLFLRGGIKPIALISSTLGGIIAAWVAATQSEWFAPLMDADSLYVFPPLASFIISVSAFVLASWNFRRSK